MKKAKANNTKSKRKSYLKDYQKLFNKQPVIPVLPLAPQWQSPGDYFVKFSLYEESQSIASPSTSLPQAENA